MYLIAIKKWKRKLIYLISIIVLITLVLTLVPFLQANNLIKTNSSQEDEDILSQPIKVQSEPGKQPQPEEKN